MNFFATPLPLVFIGTLVLGGISTLTGQSTEPPATPPPPGAAPATTPASTPAPAPAPAPDAKPAAASAPVPEPPRPGEKATPVKPVAAAPAKPIENYQQILAVLPDTPPAKDAKNWTQEEKDAANSVFLEKLVDPKAKAKFKVRVGQVANWPDPTLFVEVPNREGYHIRIFAKFSEDKTDKLFKLSKGDEVILEGNFRHLGFEDVWNKPSLSIGLGESVFTPTPAAESRHMDVMVISAVYGSGTAFADVTMRVNGLVHQPEVTFAAKPEWLKADPTPGWNKALVIVYEFEGKRHVFTTGEGGSVSAETLVSHATALPSLKEATAGAEKKMPVGGE